MNHNLPATLLPGQRYPLEIDIKNNSMSIISSRQGYRIDYEVVQGDQTLFSGIADENIILLERSSTRLRFSFTGRVKP